MPLFRLQSSPSRTGRRDTGPRSGTDYVWTTIGNTVGLAFGSLVIGMVLGTLLAWSASQLPPRLGLAAGLPILPIVIPAVANVSGWAFLSRRGPATSMPSCACCRGGPTSRGAHRRLFAALDRGDHRLLPQCLRLPVRQHRPAQYQPRADRGRPGQRVDALGTFFRVTLPLLRPCSLYGGGVALLLGLGQSTGPLLLGTDKGVTVLTTDMYGSVSQSPIDFATAAAIGSPLLVFGLAVVSRRRLLLGDQRRYVTHGGKAFRRSGKPSYLAAAGIDDCYTFVATVLPIIALLILSLSKFWSPTSTLADFSLSNFKLDLRKRPASWTRSSTSVAFSLRRSSSRLDRVHRCLAPGARRRSMPCGPCSTSSWHAAGDPGGHLRRGFLFTYTVGAVRALRHVVGDRPRLHHADATFTTRMQLAAHGLARRQISRGIARRGAGAGARTRDRAPAAALDAWAARRR